jgi:hypothetical protein
MEPLETLAILSALNQIKQIKDNLKFEDSQRLEEILLQEQLIKNKDRVNLFYISNIKFNTRYIIYETDKESAIKKFIRSKYFNKNSVFDIDYECLLLNDINY